MATDAVEICNSALVKIGAARITSLSDNTKEAKLCNQIYTPMLKEVLRAHPWNFAKKRATLSVDVTAPNWGYSARFAIPADCLRILKTQYPDDEWVQESGYILTNDYAADLKILYVMLVTDTTKFDANFDEAFATRLAHELAYPLVQSTELKARMWQEYTEKLADTRSFNGQSAGNPPQQVYADEWLNSRF